MRGFGGSTLFRGLGGSRAGIFPKVRVLGFLMSLGSHDDGKGLGIGFGDIEGNNALDWTNLSSSQPSDIEEACWGVESLPELNPSGWSFVLTSVLRLFLEDEVEAEGLLSKDLFVLVWSLDGVDQNHLSAFLVAGGPEFVIDDGSVGTLVEGEEVDLTARATVGELGWGNGNDDLSTWGLADQGTEGSLNNHVTLNSSLVLLPGEGSLEANLSVSLPGVDGVEFGLELNVLESVLIDNLECSTEGEVDGHAEVVGDWDTHGRRHFQRVFHHVEGLLVVDGESVEELGEGLSLGLLDQLLDRGLVDGEEAFHFRADLDTEGTFDFLILLTGFNSKELMDLLEFGVSLSLGGLLAELLEDVGSELLDRVSVDREFNGVDSLGSVSVLNVVTVEHVVGDVGVLGSKVFEMMEESGLNVFKELGVEDIAGLGHSWGDWFGKGDDGTGLLLHLLVKVADGLFKVSQALEGRVDEGMDFLGTSEPGGVGQLLPNGEVSSGGVEEEGDGSHTDLWVFTLVSRDGDEDGEDFAFNELIGELVLGLTINSTDLGDGHVFGLAGDNQVLEGKDGLNLNVGIRFIVENVLDDWDDLWDTQVSEGSQVSDGKVLVLGLIAVHVLLQVLDEV